MIMGISMIQLREVSFDLYFIVVTFLSFFVSFKLFLYDNIINLDFFILDIETQFMPWLMESVTVELNKTRVARAVLDSMYFYFCPLV